MILLSEIKKIFKKVCSVENVLKVMLAMGFYSNVQSSRRPTVLVKLYCILLSMILLVVPIFGLFLIYNYNPIQNTIDIVTLSCYGLEHFIYTISCLYTSQSSFQRYCSGIKIIDTTLGFNIRLKSPFMSIPYFLIIFQFLRAITSILIFPSQWFLHISRGLLVIFNTMIFATTIITYNLFFERMMLIRKLLRRQLNDLDKIYVVQKYLLSYKHLLNNLQNNNKAVTFTYFLNILINFFKIIYLTYFVMDMLFNKIFGGTIVYMSLLQNVVLCFCLLMPGFLCDLAKAEYETIKITLAYELLVCKDKQLRVALNYGIDYLECRPPSIYIYRLFPVNISLITNFIHVCTTYIIVLLQTVF